MKKRIEVLDQIIKKLYEDSVLGNLSQERFNFMLNDYEGEQKELREKVAELDRKVRQVEKQTEQLEMFTEIIRQVVDIEELDAAILNRLISRVMVGQAQKNPVTGIKEQEICIEYRFSQCTVK